MVRRRGAERDQWCGQGARVSATPALHIAGPACPPHEKSLESTARRTHRPTSRQESREAGFSAKFAQILADMPVAKLESENIADIAGRLFRCVDAFRYKLAPEDTAVVLRAVRQLATAGGGNEHVRDYAHGELWSSWWV